LQTGRSAEFIARARANRLVVQRITSLGAVIAEIPPGSTAGQVHLVDAERARVVRTFESAIALIPAPTGNPALALFASEKERKVRAEIVRLTPGQPSPVIVASYPVESAEVKWLKAVSVLPAFRPFSSDAAEVVLPDGDGCFRIQVWRPRDRTRVKFFRGTCYAPAQRWLAGPGAGISVAATFLCVESLISSAGPETVAADAGPSAR
jgi:hypothetical protein